MGIDGAEIKRRKQAKTDPPRPLPCDLGHPAGHDQWQQWQQALSPKRLVLLAGTAGLLFVGIIAAEYAYLELTKPSAEELAAQRAETAAKAAARAQQLREAHQRELENGAYSTCTEHVKLRLKAPASAEFPFKGAVTRAPGTHKPTFYVQAYVDSQNGFGAMLRNQWACQITYNGGDPLRVSSWSQPEVAFAKN